MDKEKITGFGNFPTFCQWEITRNCGLGCKGCNVPVFNEPFLPEDIVLKSFYELAYAGIKNLELIGGEPTSIPYLEKILNCINGIKEIEKAAILTNGINLEIIENLAFYFLLGKIGLVVSINYTERQCEELLRFNLDSAMVKKSLAGWKVLKEYSDIIRVRVNCVINKLNIFTFPEIAEKVLELGGTFSCCPLVYKRQDFDSDLELTFRSYDVGFAATYSHKEDMRRSVEKLKILKNLYPDKIIPSLEYLNFLVATCKKPSTPYFNNCEGLGIPYLRVSSVLGKSNYTGVISPRLRACSDIKGKHISELVVSDLEIAGVRNRLHKIYQEDPEVKRCCKEQGCPWSVTYVLRNQKNF